MSDYEKELLEKALDQSGWNQSQAAKKLHISRSGLIREMKKHGLRKERSGTPFLMENSGVEDSGIG